MYSPAAVLDDGCLVCDVFLVGVDTPAADDDDALDDDIIDKYISIVLFRGSAAGFLSDSSPIQFNYKDSNSIMHYKN